VLFSWRKIDSISGKHRRGQDDLAWKDMQTDHVSKPHGAGKSSFELIEAGKLFQILALKPWYTVLDMGCGSGMYAMAMAKIIGDGGRIHAVDLWEEGIVRLKERVERQGLKNVRPMVADVSRALSLPGESMDLILMATVLHDLREAGVQDGALAEARRLLKRHGTFAVVEFNKVQGPPGPPISIRLSPDDVTAMVEPFGFARTGLHEVGPHNYLMTFAPKVVCSA
jgi:ubiquinone/menaquinone biosynthesis C-methylase UbiE